MVTACSKNRDLENLHELIHSSDLRNLVRFPENDRSGLLTEPLTSFLGLGADHSIAAVFLTSLDRQFIDYELALVDLLTDI